MSLRRRCILALLLCLALAALTLVGCAEQDSPSESGISAHAASWMDPNSPDFHAASVAARGVDGCASCHGDDLRGDRRADSCMSCHQHPSEWLAPASDDFHGLATFASDGPNCRACHGEDLRGGWSEVSCYGLCHDGPGGHPEGWISPVSDDFHGDAIRAAEGVDGCRSCHGGTLEGGAAEVSCYEPCHDGPGGHPFTWLTQGEPTFHGAIVGSDGTEDCKSCHGPSLDGGWAEVGCNTGCHSGSSNHDDDWMTRSAAGFHGNFVEANGASSCESCHGSDYRGGWSGLSCFNACHDGPSGHPYGWTDLLAGSFHGGYVIALEGVDECTTCHGADLNSGWAPTGCYEACHDGPGGHPENWLYDADPAFHGIVVAAESADRCRICHGADLRGDWAPTNCYFHCHDGPGGHPFGWDDDASDRFHGITVTTDGTEACEVCHGADLHGGWSDVSCYTQCHAGPGGHPSNWSSESQHGNYTESHGSSSCRSCHGSDYRGGWSGVSCYRCHDGPDGD